MFAAWNLLTVEQLEAKEGKWCCHSGGKSRKGGNMIRLNKKHTFVYFQQIFQY
jgi:hypothetical protein